MTTKYSHLPGPTICIRSQTTLSDAWDLMVAWEVKHLVVTHGRALLGLMSDRDIILRSQFASDGGMIIPNMVVAAAMTPDPVTCHAGTNIAAIATTMVDHHVEATPIVDELGTILGLVTTEDLLKILAAGGTLGTQVTERFQIIDIDEPETLAAYA